MLRFPMTAGVAVALILSSAALAAPPVSSSATPVDWSLLVPPGVRDFDDPFLALSSRQLRELAQVARLREGGVRPDDGSSAGVELGNYEAALAGEGIDVDGLLARRFEIRDKRRAAAESANTGFLGDLVELSGFLMPTWRQGGFGSPFYLVASRGFCSHVALPFPNQVVAIEMPASTSGVEPYEPVRVSGILRQRYQAGSVFAVDGVSRIAAVYALDDAEITPVQVGSSDRPTPTRSFLDSVAANKEKVLQKAGSP